MTDGPGTVCGVDGAPGGWAVVRAEIAADGAVGNVTASFDGDLRTLVADLRRGQVRAAAIDMPIGLVDHQPRAADVEARKLLGPRKSSVFPTPVRATLEAVDYADACKRSRAVSGKALSKQAFNLLPKIAQLDELVRPEDQDQLVEAHPELAFVRLADGHLDHAKRTSEGQAARRELLAARFGAATVDAVLGSGVAPTLDLTDAMANLTIAAHVASGTEHRLGCEIDSTGKRAEIVW